MGSGAYPCPMAAPDWMRGAEEPLSWANKHQIPKESWKERWHLYERDLAIQQDMEFFSEAVFSLYQDHLDRMIRQNHLLWGDFCRKLVKRDPATGAVEDTGLLDLVMPRGATDVYPEPSNVRKIGTLTVFCENRDPYSVL